MSAQEWRHRFEALSERDKKIYKLASAACSAMGFACQMAAQGADNSQCKYEEKSDSHMRELFEVLAGPVEVANGGSDQRSAAQSGLPQTAQPEGERVRDLEEMVWAAASGRCMACRWPLAESKDKGCVPGDCSFRTDQHDPMHRDWLRRAKLMREITLAVANPAALAATPTPATPLDTPQRGGNHGDRISQLLARAATWKESDLRKHPTATLVLIDKLAEVLAETVGQRNATKKNLLQVCDAIVRGELFCNYEERNALWTWFAKEILNADYTIAEGEMASELVEKPAAPAGKPEGSQGERERKLKLFITRLEILKGRVEGCADIAELVVKGPRHAVSIPEIDAWIADYRAELAAQPSTPAAWKCKARFANMGANDPQDCDWPVCGCDPYADKVIEALQESGKLAAQPQPPATPPAETFPSKSQEKRIKAQRAAQPATPSERE